MDTIVFLGGGVDSLGIIRRAARMGLRCVVVDGDEWAPAFKWDDITPIVASCYEPWDVLEALATDKVYPDAVLCAGIDAPHIMSAVADKYNLVGPAQWQANMSRHKWAQKTLFSGNNITVPQFQAVTGNGLPKKYPHNIVIKPVDSRGARGVLRIPKGEELTIKMYNKAAGARSFRSIHDVMMEEWIDGMQLSSESLVQNGEILFTAYAERNYDKLEKFAPYVIEDGSICPPTGSPSFENDWKCSANEELQKCVDALNFKNGTIKGDLVWNGSNTFVIEVALRLSGGKFCSDIIPRAYNVDFTGMAIRLALGDYVWPGEIMPRMNGYVAQRFEFPTNPRCHPDRGPGHVEWGRTPLEAIRKAEEKTK